MDNRVSMALSLLARVFAVAAIGAACARFLDHAAPLLLTHGGGGATAFVMGYAKTLAQISLDLAVFSRDVLAFFGRA